MIDIIQLENCCDRIYFQIAADQDVQNDFSSCIRAKRWLLL
jgi:hypothetical protein